MIKDTMIKELGGSVRGEVLRPTDAGYESGRKVFNAMIDQHPDAIVRCAGAPDVAACVDFARAHGLPVSVRGGGHSVAGKAVSDGALMIDLSGLKRIEVGPARRTARAEPGLRLEEVDRATQASGLATPLGIVSGTGIAGLTLGGGLGWLNGKHGLACDNVVSFAVVTADGWQRTASATEHADLFWALRGGGGNFGVVTSFEYDLHPVGPVLAGMVLYPLAKAKGVLRAYHELASGCPDELSTAAILLTTPDGVPGLAIVAAYCGALDAGARALEPLRALDSPAADTIAPMAYVDLQRMLDGAAPPGLQHYWKSSFLRHLGDAAIETLVTFAASKPSLQTAIVLQQMHGAAARVPATETAFAHRQSQYDLIVLSMWPDPAAAETNIRWTRELHEAMWPLLEPGVYVNNLGEEGRERVQAAYGANYERLAAIKARYDPTNFFRLNHNIEPAVA
jgi:FAD/FMN-containing dehydrogenase